MTQWYSKDLGDRVAASAPSGQIQEAFLPFFAVAGRPIDMALFARFDPSENVVTYYFSPKAEDLAKMFDAKPCEKPSIANLTLEVGDVRCWQKLFPGETPKGTT